MSENVMERASELIDRFVTMEWFDPTASDQTQGVQTQAYLDQLSAEEVGAIARYYLNLEVAVFEESEYASLREMASANGISS